MKIGAIILARLDSSRLPAKALRPIVGRPLLARIIDLCRATHGLNDIILATSNRPIDDQLAKFAEANGIFCYRGDTNDVAARFLAAMESADLDGAVRVNGDSPFNRPALLGEAISLFRNGDFDLVTNLPGRTYPFGLSVEVVSHIAMVTACQRMTDNEQREHVTKFFYDHPDEFRMRLIKASAPGLGGIQLAVDSHIDAIQAEWIVDQLADRLMQADATELVELARRFRSQFAI